MSHRERTWPPHRQLPGNFNEAVDELEKDDLIPRNTRRAIYVQHFLEAKREGSLNIEQQLFTVGDRAVPGSVVKRRHLEYATGGRWRLCSAQRALPVDPACDTRSEPLLTNARIPARLGTVVEVVGGGQNE